MKRRFHLLLICTLLTTSAACEPDFRSHLSKELATRFAPDGVSLSPGGADELLYAPQALAGLYEGRDYQPAWVASRGLGAQGHALIELLVGTDREGLRPEDYHVSTLNALAQQVFRNDKIDFTRAADLELLLSDAFILYANHILNGRIDPRSIDSACVLLPEPIDGQTLLENALKNGNVIDVLHGLLPQEPAYQSLRAALVKYRNIVAGGGWGALPLDERVAEGESSVVVPLLRERLESEGFHSAEPNESDEAREYFDRSLAEALRHFQRNHGLAPSGTLTPQTADVLNVSAAERADQIALNLERWRWLPQQLERRHILINIAAFSLEAATPDAATLRMRVIVGKDYRRTPLLSSRIDTLVLNPAWGVPPTIAKEDLLPKVKNDPLYLAQEGIHVFDATTRAELDPESIEWKDVTAEQLPYLFRQDPGPGNPLGRIKFLFPNPFDVYLHDTPAGGLFRKDVRTFSSGCIRVERPLDLALFVLDGQGAWSREKLEKRLTEAREANRELTLPVQRPVPVHLVYWTAWADERGEAQFREDIYGRDETLRRAFQEPLPCAY